MRRLLLFAAALLLSACATSPDTTPDPVTDADPELRERLETFCARPPSPPCRENLEFSLLLDEQGTRKDYAFELLPPALQGRHLNLFPGDTFHLFGNFIAGSLVLPDVSREPPRDEPYLKFAFRQTAGSPGMMLTVKNTYDHPVKYRIIMTPPEEDTLYKTSSCPVMPGMSAFEHWPHAIFQLVVLEVRPLREDEKTVCEW